jgi:hypothetical protein
MSQFRLPIADCRFSKFAAIGGYFPSLKPSANAKQKSAIGNRQCSD